MHADAPNEDPIDRARQDRTSATLLERVRNWGDETSWARFFDIYSRIIRSMATKYGLADTQADDVVQATMIRVAERIREFQYNRVTGSFRAWIRCQARATIQLHRQRNEVEARIFHTPRPEEPDVIERSPHGRIDTDLVAEKDWNEAVTGIALSRLRAEVAPLHYQIFDLAVNKQWPVRRISRTFSISMARVYLAKGRVTRLLKQHIRQVQAELERLPVIKTQPKEST